MEHRSKTNINHLHNSFIYLRDGGVIDNISLEKLLSLFDPSKFNTNDDKERNIDIINEGFHHNKQTIFSDISELKTLLDNPNELKNIERYINKQKFSIGITGVMNAGKSTMLNALMGKEILGTNVIPETANLTVVKYSKSTSAKVIYWNQSQWEHIERSAKSINSMTTFVNETKQHFQDDLYKFILPHSRIDTIDIKNLNLYTSASLSDKKCNLVKSVELYTPLPFLEDGIEIVDTPGLDDVVVQREEITKEYLSKCDLMIHLMNVSQSATKKDIDFIIDSILYQNITKVLIVITRIDLVSSKDTQDVISYTKDSISKRLNEQNSSGKLDFILNTIDFVALSGKMALLHKTGHKKEAEDAGYSLEQSGVVEIEDYLQKTLFSEQNSRSSLIIRSARNRLGKLLHSELEKFRFKDSLLFKTEDEIDIDLKQLTEKKSSKESSLILLKSQISGYEVELSNYIQTLKHFLDNELKSLQTVMRQRLLDETKYSLEKDKKAPLFDSINRIIETALKHGLVDIIRDYRYKFIKKSSKISEIISLQYDEINERDENVYSSFEYKSIFNDSFKRGFLTANNSVLVQRVSKVLCRASLKRLNKIDDEINEIIKDEFIHIESALKEKALNLSQTLLDEFFIGLKTDIEMFENSLKESEELLRNHIKFLKENKLSRNSKSIELQKKINRIEIIAKRYVL